MTKDIPTNRISSRSDTGIEVKYTDDWLAEEPVDGVHRDDYYLFAIILDGNVTVMVDFADIPLYGGEGLILSPWQVHQRKLGTDIPQAWSLFISADNITKEAREKIERYSLAVSPLRFTPEILGDLTSLFGMLRRNIRHPEFAKAVATAIVDLFCRSCPETINDVHERYLEITLRLSRLLDMMSATEKRPSEYASKLNLSRVYLNEAVRATTGMSIGKYIRNHIILAAKRMLAHTSQTINEIADALGYEDPSYFQRLFRKETGMTPGEFRKIHRFVRS